jgi:hypothetical protein
MYGCAYPSNATWTVLSVFLRGYLVGSAGPG